MSDMSQLRCLFKKLVLRENIDIADDGACDVRDLTSTVSSLANDLVAIYLDISFRHSYSDMSVFIEDDIQADQRDILDGNLKTLYFYMDKCPDYDREIVKKVAKLADHVSLTVIQLARMEQIKYIGFRATNELKEAQAQADESQKKVDEMKSKVEGFHTNSITILGIFAGLVLGFASGTQLFMESFSNISNMNAFRMLLYIAFIGLALFDIIFMLLYAIAKISGSSIAVTCRNIDCSECRKCRCHFLRKYPYVILFNLIMIAATILFFIASKT